jgi:hypothetical protein
VIGRKKWKDIARQAKAHSGLYCQWKYGFGASFWRKNTNILFLQNSSRCGISILIRTGSYNILKLMCQGSIPASLLWISISALYSRGLGFEAAVGNQQFCSLLSSLVLGKMLGYFQQGFHSRGPPAFVARPASTFVNYMYLNITQ